MSAPTDEELLRRAAIAAFDAVTEAFETWREHLEALREVEQLWLNLENVDPVSPDAVEQLARLRATVDKQAAVLRERIGLAPSIVQGHRLESVE